MHRAKALLDTLPRPPPASAEKEPDRIMTEEELLAHVLFLQAAFRPDVCVLTGDSFFLFEVEGTGGYLVTVTVATEGGFVHVTPHMDTPEEMRPTEIACTVTCTPGAMLTMLAGGAADLQTSQLPTLQQFLRSFDFAGYGEFCAARHLSPWVPTPAAEGEDLGERVRKSFSVIASGVQKLAAGAQKAAHDGVLKVAPEGAKAAKGVSQKATQDVAGEPKPRFVDHVKEKAQSVKERAQSLKEGTQARLASAKEKASTAGVRLQRLGGRMGERLNRTSRSAEGRGSAAEAALDESGDGSLREDDISSLVDPLWQNALASALGAAAAEGGDAIAADGMGAAAEGAGDISAAPAESGAEGGVVVSAPADDGAAERTARLMNLPDLDTESESDGEANGEPSQLTVSGDAVATAATATASHSAADHAEAAEFSVMVQSPADVPGEKV
jgi:hypothetical protein